MHAQASAKACLHMCVMLNLEDCSHASVDFTFDIAVQIMATELYRSRLILILSRMTWEASWATYLPNWLHTEMHLLERPRCWMIETIN